MIKGYRATERLPWSNRILAEKRLQIPDYVELMTSHSNRQGKSRAIRGTWESVKSECNVLAMTTLDRNVISGKTLGTFG